MRPEWIKIHGLTRDIEDYDVFVLISDYNDRVIKKETVVQRLKEFSAHEYGERKMMIESLIDCVQAT